MQKAVVKLERQLLSLVVILHESDATPTKLLALLACKNADVWKCPSLYHVHSWMSGCFWNDIFIKFKVNEKVSLVPANIQCMSVLLHEITEKSLFQGGKKNNKNNSINSDIACFDFFYYWWGIYFTKFPWENMWYFILIDTFLKAAKHLSGVWTRPVPRTYKLLIIDSL